MNYTPSIYKLMLKTDFLFIIQNKNKLTVISTLVLFFNFLNECTFALHIHIKKFHVIFFAMTNEKLD